MFSGRGFASGAFVLAVDIFLASPVGTMSIGWMPQTVVRSCAGRSDDFLPPAPLAEKAADLTRRGKQLWCTTE
jgi:hypothetical protein